MDRFICKHGEVIHGALSCFDRMLFRGYLPIMSGAAMADFLQANGMHRWSLKTFLLAQAARLKKHAVQMAAAAGRPYQYLGERTRKEHLARQIASRDGIAEGLICVFSLLEVSRTFSVVWKERGSFVQSARRTCLQLYYYFMDRELGLIHVKLQTWFPFQMQIYLNGHEWLARKLDRRGVKYFKVDNAFAGLDPLQARVAARALKNVHTKDPRQTVLSYEPAPRATNRHALDCHPDLGGPVRHGRRRRLLGSALRSSVALAVRLPDRPGQCPAAA